MALKVIKVMMRVPNEYGFNDFCFVSYSYLHWDDSIYFLNSYDNHVAVIVGYHIISVLEVVS